MELSIAATESSLSPMHEPQRNKLGAYRFRKSTLKIKGKQSLVINLAIVKVPTRVKRNDHATPVTFKKAKIKNPSLKK